MTSSAASSTNTNAQYDNRSTSGTPRVRTAETSVVTIAHDQGTGSGVIWSKDGVVVTNNHVVRVQDQVVERVEVDE